MSSRTKSRKSPDNIITRIFEALPVQKVATVSELAVKVGCNWATCAHYLHLIRWIQDQPRVIALECGRRQLYQRERSKRE